MQDKKKIARRDRSLEVGGYWSLDGLILALIDSAFTLS